jgi:hypothetical protein
MAILIGGQVKLGKRSGDEHYVGYHKVTQRGK